MVTGIFCIAVASIYWTGRLRALRMEDQLLAEYQSQASQLPTRLSPPKHIFIKWFVDTDIETQVFANDQWTISSDVASYLDQSARPGEVGNMVIYGHNTRGILGNIRALKGGEQVVITSDDEVRRTYLVTELIEVEPTQTTFLEPTFEETLTIYTCSGFLDQKRFVVRAKPIY